ncbi:MAG: protein kinase domain-containing protein [Hyalangium sp.]|uniref:protein kinase domain-containing protein n=1 Tax=Hyalangium sp. TaxID=2028555 RepID=UPI00389B1A67
MQLGKYELLGKLATGGMAEVFLARAAGPMGFQKTLVVKRILPHLAQDPSFVEMFFSEAKLAAQLNHPHIVQIFDFGEAQGEYFLAMEHIDGPNLRVLLKRARAQSIRLAPTLCARIIAAACEGLAFAHDFEDPASGQPLGLVHRDISTDNILVSRQGAVKVVDFGIAKAAGQNHKTRTGLVKGKVAYMPPEQLRAEPLDRRVDVYALGVVLYELLTGRKPFDAPTDASLMQAILIEPPVPAAQLRPELPGALQRILDRALARDRQQRYLDCRAFQGALEDFILSTGKTVGVYQLSQLVTRLEPRTEALPPPVRDTVEDPAPVVQRTPAPALRPSVPVSNKETLEFVPQKPLTAPSPEPETVRVARKQRPARAQSPLRWLPALLGAAVLLAAGGYALGTRTGRAAGAPAVAPLDAAGATPVVPAPAVTLAPSEAPTPPSTSPALGADAPAAQGANVVLAAQTEHAEEHKPSSGSSRPATVHPNRSKEKQPGSPQAGTLRLIVRGWAEIWVDGKDKGRVPPLHELELPAGRHELELVNPALRPYRAFVTITAGETLEHHVLLQSAEASSTASPSEASASR